MKPRGLNKNWRRDWDSNPGDGSRPPDGFQDRCIQPLCHPSAGAYRHSTRCAGRGRAERQESLAVPALSGTCAARARNPWQCQNWVAKARKTWQCQLSVARGRHMPEIPGSARTGCARSRRASSEGAPKMRTPPQRFIYANRSPTDSLRYAAISGSLMASATFAVIHAGTVPVSNPSLGSITSA